MNVITRLAQLINPKVMTDMISAKLNKKIKTLKYAKIDTQLQGRVGNTITVPKFEYIGDAVDVAEGEEIPTRQLSVTSKSYTIKKIGIGGTITDEAVLSGYGDPVGELNGQIIKSIMAKCDDDAMDELCKAKTSYIANKILSYTAIVDGVDLFEEEENAEKVIFVHPKQVTQLRKDPDFISKEKYGNDVMANGEIGMVGGCRVVSSKKVKAFDKWYKIDPQGTLEVVADGGNDSDTVSLSKVQPSIPSVEVGAKVSLMETSVYFNPIVKLEEDAETEDEAPALSYIIKRDTNIETTRISNRRMTEITGDQLYVVALTNETKVVILKTLKDIAVV